MTSPAHIPTPNVVEDYRAVTVAGVTVRTFADRDLAVAWVKAQARTHPGMTVEHVVVTETRRRVYRPRPILVKSDRDLSIPNPGWRGIPA